MLTVFIVDMLRLTLGQTADLYLTLAESQTITDANFLCVFTSRATNEKVKFVLANASDESDFKSRYNLFTITVNDHFTESGFYHYKIYEQASADNEDEALAGAVVEQGLAFVSDSTDVSYTQFNNSTTYTLFDAE